MSTDIFTKVGTVIVFLFVGMGIATFTMLTINKFITLVLKTFKVWKLFVDFVFDYKQFKQWKNDTHSSNKEDFESEKEKVTKEKEKEIMEYQHFGSTPIQKADYLIQSFGKDNAIIYCNERIDFYKSLFNKRFFTKHINYWNNVKSNL